MKCVQNAEERQKTMFKKYEDFLAYVVFLMFLLILGCQFTGCVVSRQELTDSSYTNGLIEREITIRKTVLAPPFGSKAIANHSFDMYEDENGWQINMNSNSNLDGGKISPEIAEVFSSLVLP